MKKLILSYDSYSFVKYFLYEVFNDISNCEVVIATKDDITPIAGFPDLCQDALFYQRRYDLLKIGNFLGLKKMSNFMFDEADLNVELLIKRIQLMIMLSGVREIFFQSHVVLSPVMKAIKNNFGIPVFKFGDYTSSFFIERKLTQEESDKKGRCVDICTGAPERFFHNTDFRVERLYSV